MRAGVLDPTPTDIAPDRSMIVTENLEVVRHVGPG